MATQQVLFSETIAGMKKAFKRKAYDSDSDSEIEHYGNRGHKLKKRARFARRGQLVPATGPISYKESIDYAGVRRSIIQRNPPIFDDEGDEIDTEDDDPRAEDAVATAADLNPYANIHIEHLPTHPTLSKPFTSKTLTELGRQSCSIMRKENQSLWQVRQLWTSLCGDNAWVPGSMLVTPNDIELYTEDHVAHHLLSLSKPPTADATSPQTVNGVAVVEGATGGIEISVPATDAIRDTKPDSDVPMADAGPVANGPDTLHGNDRDGKENSTEPNRGQKQKQKDSAVENGESGQGPEDPAVTERDEAAKANSANEEGPERLGSLHERDAKNTQLDSLKPSKAPSITTAASLEESFIHPMFVAPAGSKPDRDLGLPEYEAEDVRRLLALYVQKQEEICRGAKKLHQGLLRAERLRKEVLHWAKAEAHCGPNREMSDGEDWYDKEEWGLVDDLKKGQDDDDDIIATTGKKTRNRR